MVKNNSNSPETNYRIAEIVVKECGRNPTAHTTEECMICQFNGDKCNQWQLAEKLVNEGYQRVGKDQVVIDKEELKDLEANYDKIYKQAEADILANMADGGTSCHWCIEAQRKIGAKQALESLFEATKKKIDEDLSLKEGGKII